MIDVNLSQLAQIVGGKLIGDADRVITGSVETDSRLVGAGSLFFAKPGEHTDGHNFISDALERGAVAVVAEREASASIDQVIVQDSVEALGKLAAWLVRELKSNGQLRVIGITGSNGKTTTKNMLRQILSQVGETIAPIESYNNKVGAPISILRADRNTKFLVVEM